MFKKAVEAKSRQRLSGADRKKLRRTIRNRLPLLTDELLDAILPPKVEITLSKFQNRVHVYSIEGGCPMFFYIDARGTEIFPTGFALWEAPEMLPSFILKGGEVSRYVLGGADLMFPGIFIPPEGFPSFSAGEIWAVKVPGNMAPIAVGCTTMSSADALEAGLRGKALRIIHYYHHFLWESAEGHYVPNAGFFEDVLPPLCAELRNLVLQRMILPMVLTIAQSQDRTVFELITLPALVPVMSTASGDTLLLLVKHAELITNKTDSEHLVSHVLPLLLRAYNDNDVRIQEEVLKRSTSVAKQLDGQVVRQAILPRVHALALKTTVAAVRVNALLCLAELVQTLDKPAVIEILQTTQRCTAVDRSAPTLMCTLAVANAILKQYGVEFTAEHVLTLMTKVLNHLYWIYYDQGSQPSLLDLL